MATHKPTLLPWKKKLAFEEGAVVTSDAKLSTALVQEASFVQMLRFERRRTERSGRSFMLVLISGDDLGSASSAVLQAVVTAIASCKRETDVLGWYERGVSLGLLMTEISHADAATTEIITRKITLAIAAAVSPEIFRRITIIFRLFPQEMDKVSHEAAPSSFYPDLQMPQAGTGKGKSVKRLMDVVGSLIALVLCMPVMAIIAALVKLTSKGPILFCQRRVGQHGKEFCFLKFRTMYVNNHSGVHREYIAKLIAGDDLGQGKGIYKLVNDPRVTLLGKYLRRSSLDELPQFVNVLMNDMSLVGPRPPLPYEYERYKTWHKRRVLELKPGLTGLWQVKGRSRTTFDEMVRMDLRYANIRSLRVDCRILLQTPGAMLSGRGAC